MDMLIYEPTDGISCLIKIRDLDPDTLISFARALIIEEQTRLNKGTGQSSIIELGSMTFNLKYLSAARLSLWRAVLSLELLDRQHEAIAPTVVKVEVEVDEIKLNVREKYRLFYDKLNKIFDDKIN